MCWYNLQCLTMWIFLSESLGMSNVSRKAQGWPYPGLQRRTSRRKLATGKVRLIYGCLYESHVLSHHKDARVLLKPLWSGVEREWNASRRLSLSVPQRPPDALWSLTPRTPMLRCLASREREPGLFTCLVRLRTGFHLLAASCRQVALRRAACQLAAA